MALYIFNDPEIPSFISLKNQFEISKLRALNRKRITTKTIRNISHLTVMLDDPEAVFLILQIDNSLIDSIAFCNRHNIPVIVCGKNNEDMPFLIFSSICGHAYENMRMILRYCIGAGKKRLALFGFNNVSIDKQYAEAIYNSYPDFNQEDFFQISPSFDACFERFFLNKDNYDSILFPNDFIAIAFMQRMNQLDRKYTENRFLIGISDTIISKLYFTTVTSITYSLDALLHAVSSIYRSVLKSKSNNFLPAIHYSLSPELFIRESTQSIPLTAQNTVLPQVNALRKPSLHFEDTILSYRDDVLLNEITTLENLLYSFDKLDFQILLCMLNEMSNSEISEKLYMTNKSIQYHTHKMYEYTGTDNKSKFIKFVSKYISKDNLEKYLEDSIFR